MTRRLPNIHVDDTKVVVYQKDAVTTVYFSGEPLVAVNRLSGGETETIPRKAHTTDGAITNAVAQLLEDVTNLRDSDKSDSEKRLAAIDIFTRAKRLKDDFERFGIKKLTPQTKYAYKLAVTILQRDIFNMAGDALVFPEVTE